MTRKNECILSTINYSTERSDISEVYCDSPQNVRKRATVTTAHSLLLAAASCPWYRTDIIIFVDMKESVGESVLKDTVKPFLVTFITTLKEELKQPEHKRHIVRVAIVTYGGQLVAHHCLTDDQKQSAIISSIQVTINQPK